MALSLKLKGTFVFVFFLISFHICFSSLSSSFSYNCVPYIGCLAYHGVNPNWKKLKKNNELLVKNINYQSFVGQRVIYDYFTSSSLFTKLNQYKVPAECRKSFEFIYLGYKTDFKEKRNFLKKTAKNEVKMEEVVNMK